MEQNEMTDVTLRNSLRTAETFSEVEIVYAARIQLAIAREHYQKEKEE